MSDRSRYYHGAEDYFNHTACGWGQFPAENFESSKVECFDLHRQSKPHCGAGCSVEPWEDHGTYSTTLFGAEAMKIIRSHPVEAPLFLYLPWQGVSPHVEKRCDGPARPATRDTADCL